MTAKGLKTATLLIAACLALPGLQAASAQAESLPRQRDIPQELSTVICPDPAATRHLIEDYYRVNAEGIFDTYHFFHGLKETGCQQDRGPLTIEEVLSRKVLSDGLAGSYMAYRGRRPDGDTVFGIVDDVLNDTHPRTAFGQWMELHAPGGRLINHPGGGRLYLCRSPDAARQVIRAIPPVQEPGAANPHQYRARDRAFAANGCTLAQGEYQITAIGDSVFIGIGPEAGEEWTALEATDDKGRKVGLVFDAEVM